MTTMTIPVLGPSVISSGGAPARRNAVGSRVLALAGYRAGMSFPASTVITRVNSRELGH